MIERVNYKGWADALRITNNVVEIVVVPSVARVMRYGFVGEPNVLWENPQAAGKAILLNTWPNTGGDKVWIWPQSDWPKIIGRSFPAPPGADQAPHQAEVIGLYGLRLTSPPVVPWGLRVVRDILVSPSGTHVMLVSRFIAYRDTPFPVGVWTITQVPPTAPVYVRLQTPPTNDLPGGFRTLGKSAGKTTLIAPKCEPSAQHQPARRIKSVQTAICLQPLATARCLPWRQRPPAKPELRHRARPRKCTDSPTTPTL